MLSTVWVTALDAVGKTGSNDIPSNEWLNALHEDQPVQYKKSITWSRIQLAFHTFIILFSIVSGLWVLPLVFTFCSFIGNWLSYFVALPQHCGLQENVSDFRKSTRSLKLPGFVEFLYCQMTMTWLNGWCIMFFGTFCIFISFLLPEGSSTYDAQKNIRWSKRGGAS